MKTKADLIEKNLYELYNQIIMSGFCHYGISDTFSWAWLKPYAWPSKIFNCHPNLESDFVYEISNRIESEEIPPFIILRGDKFNLNAAFEDKSIRLIHQWKGMICEKSNFVNLKGIDDSIKIKVIDQNSDIIQWSKILSEFLFQNKPLNNEIFCWLKSNTQCYFLMAYYQDVPVSTAMSFNDGETVGLYMISTHTDYRKKGIGSLITSTAMKMAFDTGSDKIILQATNLGLPVYEKLGFVEECHFDIFWKIGKFI